MICPHGTHLTAFRILRGVTTTSYCELKRQGHFGIAVPLAQSVMTNGVAGQAFRMAKADIGISFEWRT